MTMRRRTISRTRMRIRQWVHTSAVREGSMRGGEVRPTSGRSKCWLCQSGTNTQIGGASCLVYTHRWAIVLIIASELWRWLVMLWHSWRWGCANEQLPFIFISLVMVARKVHDIVKTCGCKEQIFFSLNITYLAMRFITKNGKAQHIKGTVNSSTAVYPPKPIFICSFW